MYILLYELDCNKLWECVDGEDAMHIRVSELCDMGLNAENIMVFDIEDEIR